MKTNELVKTREQFFEFLCEHMDEDDKLLCVGDGEYELKGGFWSNPDDWYLIATFNEQDGLKTY